MKYEERAQAYLTSLYGDAYVPAPWYTYQENSESRIRYAQPDGLLFDPVLERIIIVEIKLSHTEKSWWQLTQKYGPIIRHVFPWAQIGYCELCQWFDVSSPYPESVHLRPAVRMARPDEIQVTIWKP